MAAGTGPSRLLSPADNALVRAVGRLPAGVHVKLLVAFVGTAVLVVVLGALGLRLLGQSNERVEMLGKLQQRAFAYGKLRSDASHVRLLQAQHVGGDFYKNFPDLNRVEDDAAGLAIDRATVSAVAQIPASTYRENLGFRPPPEDVIFLRRIRETGARLLGVMRRIVEVERCRGLCAGDVASQSGRAARDRPQSARRRSRECDDGETDALIAQNESSYASQRNLFIGVGQGRSILALLLGLVLSWSVIGPIQRIDSRLAAIASGDFSGHVDVTTATSSARSPRT